MSVCLSTRRESKGVISKKISLKNPRPLLCPPRCALPPADHDRPLHQRGLSNRSPSSSSRSICACSSSKQAMKHPPTPPHPPLSLLSPRVTIEAFQPQARHGPLPHPSGTTGLNLAGTLLSPERQQCKLACTRQVVVGGRRENMVLSERMKETATGAGVERAELRRVEGEDGVYQVKGTF